MLSKTKNHCLLSLPGWARKLKRNHLKIQMMRNKDDEEIRDRYDEADQAYKDLCRGSLGGSQASWLEQIHEDIVARE